ncbi:MAG: hypothetical protein K0U45_09340 [Alphaproteobacteria bacterium]|nr:hypothetical protein [Alphaproteobacteria bacterium]
MSNNNNILKAIYETKRQQLTISWLNPQTRKYINNAYFYAYYTRMFPFFHANENNEDLFLDVHDIDKKFVDEVTEYLEKNDSDVNLHFHTIEMNFDGHTAKRMELIFILQYCFLSGKFKETIKTILRNTPPMEVKDVIGEIDESNIRLY